MKECRNCNKGGVQLHHFISEHMARLIIWRQFQKNGKVSHLIASSKNEIRRNKGNIWLCVKCHRKADYEQRVIEKLLEEGIESPKNFLNWLKEK